MQNEQNANIIWYFNPNELREPPDKENFLKVFDLNLLSLPYHCSEHHSLLSKCNIDFDVSLESKKTKKHYQISKYHIIKASSALHKGLMVERYCTLKAILYVR